MNKISDAYKFKIVYQCLVDFVVNVDDKDMDTFYITQHAFDILNYGINEYYSLSFGTDKLIPFTINNDIENFGYSTPNKRRLQKLKNLYD